MNLDKFNLVELNISELTSIDGGVNGNEMTREQAKAVNMAIKEVLHIVGDFLRGFYDGL